MAVVRPKKSTAARALTVSVRTLVAPYTHVPSCRPLPPGDWFNRIDWSAATHNFGVGLPVSTKNGGAWGYMAPLLADAERIRPSQQQMLTATRMFQVRRCGCVRGLYVRAVLHRFAFWAGGAWAVQQQGWRE